MLKPYTPQLLRYMFLAAAFFCFTSLIAQSNWYSIADMSEARALELEENATILPDTYLAIEMNYQALFSKLLSEAPIEFSGKSGLELAWPMPDGSSEIFEFFYAPTAEAEFLVRHPEIRSFKAVSKSNHNTIMRLTFSRLGLKGAIKTPSGLIYIDPVVEGTRDIHAIYEVAAFGKDVLSKKIFKCGHDDDLEHALKSIRTDKLDPHMELRGAGDAISLKVFRTAISTTGEWTQREGGKDNALSKIMASLDRGNLVFENEVGIRLILVANNDTIVFDNGDTDPYIGNSRKDASDLINVNTTHINRRIGVDNYDVGHIFTLGCLNNVGGLARTPCVCDADSKAAGTTCWSNTDLEFNITSIFCHEMAHQFSAPHTFNHCDRDNENMPTGYEPGSGSTIMSYAGSCGTQNVQSGSNDYYHANTLMNMFTHSRNVGCGTEMNTSNTRPDVAFNHENGLTIPISTPFYLRGTGTDAEGDNMTYNIEQHDFSLSHCDRGTPTGSCPAFRSVVPGNNDYRVFPNFNSIWNNQTFSGKNEVLVDYSREMNFVMTARDNNAESGGFGMDTVTFDVTDGAGPFVLTSPNNGEAQTAGKHSEITWDVANTDQLPVNCQNVDILLYNDSDFESFIVLKNNTENDGSEWVIMPNMPAQDLRIMIRASDNIFFDISNTDMDIEAASEAGYSFAVSPNTVDACLPDMISTTVETAAFGGYQGQVDLDVISGLPAGATYSFDETTLDAGQSTTLNIDLTNVTDDANAVIVVQAMGDNGETLEQQLNLNITRSDFSALAVVDPLDGTQGVEQTPDFTWSPVADAVAYDVQVASNPAFDVSSIVQEFLNVSGTSVSLTEMLEKSTIYYWRVRAKNACGNGEFVIPSAFSTEASVCSVFEGPDKNIVVQKGRVTEFEMDINANAEITDLNVSSIDFFCDFLQDATISVISPRGTEVVLADKACGNTTEMLCGFDDAASSSIKCPPNTGRNYRPKGKLSDFNTENAQGTWKLKLDILSSAVSSELGSWELEVCSNSALNAPYLVINETMYTKPNENNPISNLLLRTNDDNNSDDELTYTITSLPTEGELQLNGSTLSTGMTFTQADVNGENVTYNNTGGMDALDAFVFTVNDGEGGWTGSHTFEIDINEINPSSVSDLDFRSFFKVYPNPTDGIAMIVFDNEINEKTEITVTDLKGRLLQTLELNPGSKSRRLDFSSYTSGLYILKASDSQQFYLTKISVSHSK